MARKRILVTVSPELDKVLGELASETGGAKASIAGELLEQSVPTLVEMTKFMRMAKTKQAEAFELLNDAVMTSIGSASQLGLEISEVKKGLRRYPERASKKTEKKKSED